MEPIPEGGAGAQPDFWAQEPKRRGSRRGWLWLVLGVLAAALHELTGCPRHFTFT
ncbi:MAG: hypothetical protein AAB225_16305 [Acidobacteriota bacterium]